MLIGGPLGYHLLRWLKPARSVRLWSGAEYVARSKIEALLGPAVWPELIGKTVLDFGCGDGHEVIDLARRGAAHVVGLDNRPQVLAVAHRAARAAGVAHHCSFTTAARGPVDAVLSLDAFEHFEDPAAVLAAMAGLLRPGGVAHIAFGPTWLHPRGGHSFSVFPWAHLLFTERALLRWRADFTRDGATNFRTVEGGLNQMTVRRFRRLVAESPLEFAAFECVPIRVARLLHNRWTREFLTSFVRCRLIPRDRPA